MITRCGLETAACLADRDCLKTLACLVPCGDDQTCTFHCTVNYENQLFHEMTACNINKAGCIKLKGEEGREGRELIGSDLSEPEVEASCDMKDMFAVSELTEQQLQGTWYIVRSAFHS